MTALPAGVSRAVVGLYVRAYRVDMDECVAARGRLRELRSVLHAPAQSRAAHDLSRTSARSRARRRARSRRSVPSISRARCSSKSALTGWTSSSATREDAKRYAGGQFAIVYLSPRDYHRVHSPAAGTCRSHPLDAGRSLPGQLDRRAARPSLFSKNRRVAIVHRHRGPRARHGRDGRRDHRRAHHGERASRARRAARRPRRSRPSPIAQGRRDRHLSPGLDGDRVRRAGHRFAVRPPASARFVWGNHFRGTRERERAPGAERPRFGGRRARRRGRRGREAPVRLRRPSSRRRSPRAKRAASSADALGASAADAALRPLRTQFAPHRGDADHFARRGFARRRRRFRRSGVDRRAPLVAASSARRAPHVLPESRRRGHAASHARSCRLAGPSHSEPARRPSSRIPTSSVRPTASTRRPRRRRKTALPPRTPPRRASGRAGDAPRRPGRLRAARRPGPDRIRPSDEHEHAEEIEPEPDSMPGVAAAADTRVLEARSSVPDEPAKAAPSSSVQRLARRSHLRAPPEVDPADVEIHETASPARSSPQGQGKPPPIRLPLPLPLYARGAELAAAVQAQQTAETPAGKRARYWWDELFGDDFLRTMDRLTERRSRTRCNFIEDSLGVQKGGIILDLACGPGRHAVELAVPRLQRRRLRPVARHARARRRRGAGARARSSTSCTATCATWPSKRCSTASTAGRRASATSTTRRTSSSRSRFTARCGKGGMLLLDVANRDFVDPAPAEPGVVRGRRLRLHGRNAR